MKRLDLILLYIISLMFLSINLIFQKAPGYMDSEYYFLGGKQLSEGEISLPVIWNYLDDPEVLPHPLFSYWMPLASVVSGISMTIFGSTYSGSRIVLLLLAAGLAPFTYYVGYNITANRFVSIIAGSIAIFSGYYFKLLTIPETVLISMFLGAVFFIFAEKILLNSNLPKNQFIKIFILGIVSGLLHLSRVDGIIFLLLGIFVIFYYLITNKTNLKSTFWFTSFLVFVVAYSLIMSWWFFNNLNSYHSIFSPASSRAVWIATYDDTFIYPASQLSPGYWIENGLALRPIQVLDAIKLNLGTILGVQLLIVGLPLFIIGIKRNSRNILLRIGIIHLLFIFFIMTLIFPLAGSRGGFLHASSANQVIVWIIIADGLQGFLEWGIRKRNWKLQRSQKMFGSAFILITLFFTFIIYKNDVIGDDIEIGKWQLEYQKYEKIEKIISDYSVDNQEVIMINNPLGYHYSTGRWSVVVPNSDPDKLLELVNMLKVKFIVLDQNLPEKFSQGHFYLINGKFSLIYDGPLDIKIYEIAE